MCARLINQQRFLTTMNRLVKFSAYAFGISFGLMIIFLLVGNIYEAVAAPGIQTTKQLGTYSLYLFFSLFLVICFSAPPVLLYVFIKLYGKFMGALGGQNNPRVTYITENEDKIILWGSAIYWSIFLLGAIIIIYFTITKKIPLPGI